MSTAGPSYSRQPGTMEQTIPTDLFPSVTMTCKTFDHQQILVKVLLCHPEDFAVGPDGKHGFMINAVSVQRLPLLVSGFSDSAPDDHFVWGIFRLLLLYILDCIRIIHRLPVFIDTEVFNQPLSLLAYGKIEEFFSKVLIIFQLRVLFRTY